MSSQPCGCQNSNKGTSMPQIKPPPPPMRSTMPMRVVQRPRNAKVSRTYQRNPGTSVNLSSYSSGGQIVSPPNSTIIVQPPNSNTSLIVRMKNQLARAAKGFSNVGNSLWNQNPNNMSSSTCLNKPNVVMNGGSTMNPNSNLPNMLPMNGSMLPMNGTAAPLALLHFGDKILQCLGVGQRVRNWLKSAFYFWLGVILIYQVYLYWTNNSNNPNNSMGGMMMGGMMGGMMNGMNGMMNGMGMNFGQSNGQNNNYNNQGWNSKAKQKQMNNNNNWNWNEDEANWNRWNEWDNQNQQNWDQPQNGNGYWNRDMSSTSTSTSTYTSNSLPPDIAAMIPTVQIPLQYGINSAPSFAFSYSNITFVLPMGSPGLFYWTTYPFRATPWCNVTTPCSVSPDMPLSFAFRGVVPGSYYYTVKPVTLASNGGGYQNRGPFASKPLPLTNTDQPGYGAVIVQLNGNPATNTNS